VMLCQRSTDELEAAARVISRSHAGLCRMAARRRRMGANGSPTGGAAKFGFSFRVLRLVLESWTMRRPGEILLRICYFLTKVEASSVKLCVRVGTSKLDLFRPKKHAQGAPTDQLSGWGLIISRCDSVRDGFGTLKLRSVLCTHKPNQL
jgi:hypothetical protein